MKYRYSVVTSIFNNYENVREIANPQDDVEYILITDNPNLKSNTWKIHLFNKYDKIENPEYNWLYVKFFTFEFCSTDTCIYIDGSMQVLDGFDELVLYANKNNIEYGVVFDLPWNSIKDWFYSFGEHFHSYETKEHILSFLTQKGYDITEYGTVNSGFIFRKNTDFSSQIDNFAWDLMKSYDRGIEGFRENQHSLVIAFKEKAYHDKRLMLLDQNIFFCSPWVKWMNHNSVYSTQGSSSHYQYNTLDFFRKNRYAALNNKLYKLLNRNDIIEKKPLLTVVITCYNKQNTIKRAIESVKKMSYSNWECIIVNNNSTDNSLSIIFDEIQHDDRFKVISQVNKNVCNARNIGSFTGNGKYLVHLDGDDEIGRIFCEQCIEFMEKYDDICIGSGIFRRIYLNGKTQYISTRAIDFHRINTISPELFMRRELLYNMFTVTSVIRMDRFKAIGGFREGTEYTCEDWDMFIRYFEYDTTKLNVYYTTDDMSVIMYEQQDSKTKTQNVNWTNYDNERNEMKELNPHVYEKYNI